MPRPRKSPGQRKLARQQAVKRYNASDKGIAARTRWQSKQQVDLARAIAAEQQQRSERAQVKGQEIRDDSGRLIAIRLPNGTIQAVVGPTDLPDLEQREEQR